MKKLLCFFLVIFVLVSPVLAADGSTLVYTTRTGECYHRYSCSSLSKSCYETTLAQAVADGYRPCGRCHPPTLDGTALERAVEERKSSGSSSYSGYSSGSSSSSSGSSKSSPLRTAGVIALSGFAFLPLAVPVFVGIGCVFDKLFKKKK